MERFKQRKRFLLGVMLSAAALVFFNPGESRGQLACEGTLPVNFGRPWVRPADNWDGYVFQLDPAYLPQNDWNRDFTGLSGANRAYKGYLLRDGVDFLSTSGLAFDTRFSDYSVDGTSRDLDFFPTGTTPTSAGGCDTQLSHFGVILRSKKTITEPGIYRVRVGSDDGSFFRMFENGLVSNLTLDVNGDPVTHDNWYKDGSDGLYNFVYSQNIRNYYVPFDGGESIWMDLHYYENEVNSRLSFAFELYFGPGEVANPGDATGVRSYCGIAPDPEPFESLGPAVFAEGSEPTYQWEYTTLSNPTESDWLPIAGATGLTYDIPQYDALTPANAWTGTRYFRRKAENEVVDGEGNTQVNTFASNVLEVTIDVIADLDQAEYGTNEWIGHIYSGIRNYDAQDYLGRMTETAVFVQDFDYNGLPSSPVTFTPDYGCPFLTDRFSVRYKMRLDVEPGTLNFAVRVDDGFRLSVDGGATWLLSGQWASGGSTAQEYTAQFDVPEGLDQLEMVLEYYENTGGNTLDFDYEFVSLVLPLRWGRFEGKPCGSSNCLSWETLQEKNTSHFVIERSTDGAVWTALDETISSSGNSNARVHYQAVDSSFESMWTYYRIKQVDLDGAFGYSEVIRISNSPDSDFVRPFPNPTVDFIHFGKVGEVSQVTLSSQDQRIQQHPVVIESTEHGYGIDMRQYPAGMYFLTLQTRIGSRTFKVIKR
ncbi:T9SS type A sorting domain-containing protein [Cyclobacterium xiamenense]|uniref:T9SS type A sorting domain-containing protein n=1 Tax=Cyclobacterium xiamenense TaxID=1297121 RepID=UPI0035D0741B